MSIIIPVLLVVEYLSFLIYDIFRNRGRYDKLFVIRMMAGGTGAVLALLEMLLSEPFEPCNLLIDVTAAAEMLVTYPCSYEKPSLSFRTALLLDGAVAVSFLVSLIVPSGSLSFKLERLFWSYVVIMVIFTFYFAATAVRRFNGIRMFFRNSAVWHNVEDYSRFIYSMLFLSLGIWSLCAVIVPGDAGNAMAFLTVAVFMVLYAILYLRGLTGRTYVLNPDTERKIKDVLHRQGGGGQEDEQPLRQGDDVHEREEAVPRPVLLHGRHGRASVLQ